GGHPGQLVLGEQARLVQDAGVGTGAGDVVRREPPVEVDGRGQPGQRLGRSVGEAGAPETYVAVAVAVAHYVLLGSATITVRHNYAEVCMLCQRGGGSGYSPSHGLKIPPPSERRY